MKMKSIVVAVTLAASFSSQAAVLDLDLDLLSGNVTQLNTQVAALNGQVTTILDAAPAYIGQLNETTASVAALNGKVDSYAGQAVNAYNSLDGRINQTNATLTDVQATAQIANEKGDALAVRADGLSDSIKETNAQVAVTDGRSINNAVRLDGVEGAVRETNGQLADQGNRITNAQNTADTAIRGVQQNTNDIVNVRNTASVALATGQKGVNDAANAQSTADTAVKGVQQNSNRITNVETVQGQQAETLNNHETRIATNAQNINTIGNDFYGYQQSNNAAVAAGDARTLSQSKDYTNQKFSELKNQVDGNKREIAETRKEARAGVSAAMAMASIPNVAGQTFSMGAGVGSYAGQSAIAVGGNWNVSPRVSTRVAVSYDNASKAGIGAGMAFGF